jgi:NitT/TauT family transport system permease protein
MSVNPTTKRDRQKLVRALTTFVVAALLWEFIGRYVITGSYAFAPLSAVLVEAYNQFASGAIWKHIWTSGLELLLGFGSASIVGIGMGIIIGIDDRVSDYSLPFVYAVNATPIVALAPLFIIMFGLGIVSKVVVIFLLCYFAVLVNTIAGVRTVEPILVEAAIAFGASRGEIIRKVLLPNAVPFIVAGLRSALGRGLVGVVVAELYGASAGLGWLSWYASEQMKANLLFVAVLILALAGIASTYGLDVLEQRIAPWRQPAGRF